jgi:hypothetical protein
MTSIIKVDQIQTTAGGTPTAADLGLNVSGTVLAAYSAGVRVGQGQVTWSITTNPSSQYGSGYTNRTYIEAAAITLTPKSSSSTLICTGTVGWSSGMSYSNGAFGQIITLNDTSAIDTSDYPFYPTSTSLGGSYFPTGIVHGSFTLANNNQVTVRLRPFGYIESGSYTAMYKGHYFSILEIAG